MVRINFTILIFSLFFSTGFGQIITVSDSVVFSGIVINTLTDEGLADVHCRYAKTKGCVSDENGFFRLSVQRGDSVVFTYVGFRPCVVVIPDSLYEREYVLGVFMSPDTLLLSEALILRRRQDVWQQNMVHLRNNMSGILQQAFAPVKEMDAAQNQRMMVDNYARSIEMKGHVDVRFGVGTQALDVWQLSKVRKKLNGRIEWRNPEEVDMLKKIYYLEKRKKIDD
ncbi:MAG: carboxypeptidase-like regulatory domain-containing protein [Odoribacter sp.]|nr:carboxypeptidase-like regulatory domain-containing protein [Odoribacter sp.]